jgi:hypothetical protein
VNPIVRGKNEGLAVRIHKSFPNQSWGTQFHRLASAAAGTASKIMAPLRHQNAASGRSPRMAFVARQKMSHPTITTVARTYHGQKYE